jgi:DNA-binding MarR family transcriptional regulator
MAEYAALRGLVETVVRDGKAPDLSLRELGLLVTVAESAGTGLSTKDLAEKLSVNKPSMTRATDKLVGLGFVVRTQHPMDRRLVEINATAAGKACLRTLAKAVRA